MFKFIDENSKEKVSIPVELRSCIDEYGDFCIEYRDGNDWRTLFYIEAETGKIARCDVSGLNCPLPLNGNGDIEIYWGN